MNEETQMINFNKETAGWRFYRQDDAALVPQFHRWWAPLLLRSILIQHFSTWNDPMILSYHMYTWVGVGRSWHGRRPVQGGGGGGDGHQQGDHQQGRQQGPHLIIGPISESKSNQELLTITERDIEWRGTCLHHDLDSSSYMHSNYSGPSLKLVCCN